MRRKVFLLILSFMMVVFVGSLDVAGQEGNKKKLESNEDTELIGAVNTGIISSPVESVEEQLEGLSEEQREMALEKLNYECSDTLEIAPCAVTWTYLSGFTMYNQATSYYCVVASCKAAIQHLTGSSDAQSVIAEELGTTTSGTPFSRARTYLNSKQTANIYMAKDASISLSTMKSNFYSAINYFNAPPLISVRLEETEGWFYDTNGHTMCISGARSDKAQFRVADPFIRWVLGDNKASMFYTMPSSKIHVAITERGNGYIY